MKSGTWITIAALLLAGTAYAQNQGQRQSPAQGQQPPADAPATPFPEPNMDLIDLVQQVAETSGRDFVINARANRRVYVGGTGLDNPSYPELLSILRNNGLAATQIEGLVNIFPETESRTAATPLLQEDDPNVPDDALVVRVISMPEGRSAPQLVPILRPLMAQWAHMAAVGDQNKLLIMGRYANVRRLTEIVNALNE